MSRMLSAIGDSPMEPFWSALNGAKNLRTLNIVFQDTLEDEMENLVRRDWHRKIFSSA